MQAAHDGDYAIAQALGQVLKDTPISNTETYDQFYESYYHQAMSALSGSRGYFDVDYGEGEQTDFLS